MSRGRERLVGESRYESRFGEVAFGLCGDSILVEEVRSIPGERKRVDIHSTRPFPSNPLASPKNDTEQSFVVTLKKIEIKKRRL